MQELIKTLERQFGKPISKFDNLEWDYISSYLKLSEDFIREYQHKVDWVLISIFQDLSEDFIRENQDKVYWEHILKWQKLSEDFIREYKDKCNENPKKKWYQFWKKIKVKLCKSL